jgi:hypothetical protein
MQLFKCTTNLLQQTVHEWIKMFHNAQTNVTHAECLMKEGNTEQGYAIILCNRTATISEAAKLLHINHCSAYQNIHDRQHFHEVCARWIPKQLTA